MKVFLGGKELVMSVKRHVFPGVDITVDSRAVASIVLVHQGLTVDVEGFKTEMEQERIKSGEARMRHKAAGGKPMVLEPDQVCPPLPSRILRMLSRHSQFVLSNTIDSRATSSRLVLAPSRERDGFLIC